MTATNKLRSDDVESVLRALSNPGRRALVERLKRGPAPVTELARALGLSLPMVSKHLKALQSAGLIDRSVRGRTHLCTLNSEPLRTLADWLGTYQGFWQDQLAALARHVEEDPDE